MKIEFVSANGYIDGSSYVSFTIKNGDSGLCFGDQIWLNETECEIYEGVDEDALMDFLESFSPKSKKAMQGALRRIGVI